MTTYFLCGIGGSGMFPLAQLLLTKGHTVKGSDRSYDQGKFPEKFKVLEKMGVVLCPQDGSGINSSVDFLVVSSAVEPSIPDVKASLELGISIKKRAEILAELFNAQKGISVAGTSGKTTVTAMMGYVLSQLDQEPTIVNGGMMKNFADQAMVMGKGAYFVTETDESDGSISFFNPHIAVLNNIALDHKPLTELREIFKKYLEASSHAVIVNGDNAEAMDVLKQSSVKSAVIFAISNKDADLQAQNLKPAQAGISFEVYDKRSNKRYDCVLNVPGAHNVSNAMAVLATIKALSLPLDKVCKVLEGFKGTKRRLEIVGKNIERNITVYDDFGHNPDKITASLKALNEFDGRLLLFFQPHGFGPMKMMRKEIVEAFASNMTEEDILVMPEIYYAGGTAERSISSKDLINDVQAAGRQAQFFETRQECGDFLTLSAHDGDRIVIMGARDDSLSAFAQNVLDSLTVAKVISA
ncbi:MAG: UDP-N-acetylmuramate--alanine ligase [Micavibrio sp.]|nr:UDP-N-acetylmuramate--alanine ligase [Micavibrio sp.]